MRSGPICHDVGPVNKHCLNVKVGGEDASCTRLRVSQGTGTIRPAFHGPLFSSFISFLIRRHLFCYNLSGRVKNTARYEWKPQRRGYALAMLEPVIPWYTSSSAYHKTSCLILKNSFYAACPGQRVSLYMRLASTVFLIPSRRRKCTNAESPYRPLPSKPLLNN